METLKNEYQLVTYEKENKLLKQVYKKNTTNLNDKKYQKQELLFAEEVKKYSPCCLLIDFRDFNYPIIPEIQDWIVHEIFPVYVKAGVKKMALLESAEMIAQLSIEQTVDEDDEKEIEIEYFSNENQAREWLL